MNVLRLDAKKADGSLFKVYINPEAISSFTEGPENTTHIKTSGSSVFVIDMPVVEFDELLCNRGDAENQLDAMNETLLDIFKIMEAE